MSYTCDFCNKVFSSKYILKTHKASAKYCILIQTDISQTVILPCVAKCVYCNKSFTQQSNKDRHELKCKTSKSTVIILSRDEEIDKLKSQIAILELRVKSDANTIAKLNTNYDLQIKNLQDKNKTLTLTHNSRVAVLIAESANERALIYKDMLESRNKASDELAIKLGGEKTHKTVNTINSIQNRYTHLNAMNLCPEKLSIDAELFTRDHYAQTGKGIAQWAYENVCRDEHNAPTIVCSDKSRRNYVYKDPCGKVVSSTGVENLKSSIKTALIPKFKQYKGVELSRLGGESDSDNEDNINTCIDLYKNNMELRGFDRDFANMSFKGKDDEG